MANTGTSTDDLDDVNDDLNDPIVAPGRARVFGLGAAVATVLTVLFLKINVFLVPVAGITGMVLVWLARRYGNRAGWLLVCAAICALVAAVAGLALLLLLPGLPKMSFSNVRME